MSFEEARDRVRLALPHIKLAITMCQIEQGEGDLKLGILHYAQDGKTGRVTCSFEFKDFLDDIAQLAGVKDHPGWFEEDVRDPR